MPTASEKFAKEMMKQLPKGDLWRLFIDGYRQGEGQYAFDKGFGAEGGYHDSMISAWNTMITELERPLDVQYFSELHELATGSLTGTQERDRNKLRRLHDEPNEFGLLSADNTLDALAWNTTKEGIREFVEDCRKNEATLKQGKQDYWFGVVNPRKDIPDSYDIYRNDKTPDQVADEINNHAKRGDVSFAAKGDSIAGAIAIIDKYHREIATATNDDEKLLAIARCVGKLERLHAFKDANCRTMILVLNKLLLQNCLTPAILENPNRMDMLSSSQLVQQIKLGQQTFKANSLIDATAYIEANTLTAANMAAYKTALASKLSNDPLQALSQLNALFERLSSHDIPLKSEEKSSGPKLFSTISKAFSSRSPESKMLMDLLQSIYQDKFIEVSQKMAQLKQANPGYQREFQELDAKKSTLNTAQRDQHESVLKLAHRTPVAIEWMEARMKQIVKEHKAIIEYTSPQQKSTLKQDVQAQAESLSKETSARSARAQ